MERIHGLAERLYGKAVYLKSQKSSSLARKKHREEWLFVISDMLADLREMADLWDNSFSYEYLDLIEEMEGILKACEACLCAKNPGYKAQSGNYMHAFHNLPRAFLPPENRMRISVAEAREYAAFWLERGAR
ncbi:MAG: hypothetical protein IJW21_06980 [Clostridia bacterium]|nr:hypothetical protein [Clostridia bacterium]